MNTERTGGRVRLLLALLATGVLAAGCGGGPQSASSASADPMEDPTRVERAVVTVEASGDVSVRWEEEADVTIVAMTPSEEMRLFSIGLGDMHPLADGREHFRWAVDVFGDYHGAGTYEIPAVVSDEQSVRSSAFLVYSRVTDASADPIFTEENVERVAQFNLPRQPCVVEVGEDQEHGSVVCPELADEDGNTIAFRATWRLVH